jgi:hypothetical protein
MSVQCDSLQYPGILPCQGREGEQYPQVVYFTKDECPLSTVTASSIRAGGDGQYTQEMYFQIISFKINMDGHGQFDMGVSHLERIHTLTCILDYRSQIGVNFPQSNNMNFDEETQIDSAFLVTCICEKVLTHHERVTVS